MNTFEFNTVDDKGYLGLKMRGLFSDSGYMSVATRLRHGYSLQVRFENREINFIQEDSNDLVSYCFIDKQFYEKIAYVDGNIPYESLVELLNWLQTGKFPAFSEKTIGFFKIVFGDNFYCFVNGSCFQVANDEYEIYFRPCGIIEVYEFDCVDLLYSGKYEFCGCGSGISATFDDNDAWDIVADFYIENMQGRVEFEKRIIQKELNALRAHEGDSLLWFLVCAMEVIKSEFLTQEEEDKILREFVNSKIGKIRTYNCYEDES